MTKRKSDGGPERGDGKARGVSGGERVTLPYFATQPMINSGPVKHRIVHGWADHNGMRTVIGSDGRMWVEARSGWREIPTYPPGLEP